MSQFIRSSICLKFCGSMKTNLFDNSFCTADRAMTGRKYSTIHLGKRASFEKFALSFLDRVFGFLLWINHYWKLVRKSRKMTTDFLGIFFCENA